MDYASSLPDVWCGMKRSYKRFVCFALATLLIFAAMNLPFLVGRMPDLKSDPPCVVGIIGWLWIAQGTEGPGVERIFLARLAAEICLAGGATLGFCYARSLTPR
jgi:hypothetical protein